VVVNNGVSMLFELQQWRREWNNNDESPKRVDSRQKMIVSFRRVPCVCVCVCVCVLECVCVCV
jgi:hypothetical protein